MTNFGLESASLPLRQIMLAESSQEWKPAANTSGAHILIDGEWEYVDPQRISEAAEEIRCGDEHPQLRNY